jgi:hypothetical protein
MVSLSVKPATKMAKVMPNKEKEFREREKAMLLF